MASVPVVVMTPVLLTVRPVLDTVVTKVTAPVLLTTVMGPGANVLEAFDVVAPVVGDVWVMVVPPPADAWGGATVVAANTRSTTQSSAANLIESALTLMCAT